MPEDQLNPSEPDIVLLASQDEYAKYYNLMTVVLSRLVAWHRKLASQGQYEAGVIEQFVERLLYTIRVLRMKYTYSVEHGLKVDLTDSGFPAAMEIMHLETDLARKEEVLRALPPASFLKLSMLDTLLKERVEPRELLWQMSQRAYMTMLDPDKVFLTFSPGKLEQRGQDVNERQYVFSWGCYDFQKSRPYVHVMTFTQDRSSDPLHLEGPTYAHFMQVVKHEGSRAPDLAILAASIDDALEDIHPKVIKRVCIGPMFSRSVVHGSEVTTDPLYRSLAELLYQQSKADDEFLLAFKEEVVFSREQQVTKKLFASSRVREIFHIPVDDPECYQSRASVVHRSVILSHALLQHIDGLGDSALPGFEKFGKITYSADGGLYGV